MNLKEELAKLEEEEIEEEQDKIELIRREETADKITGLYRRIAVIVEYIDNKEVATITEEQLKQDEQHFREEGIRKAWELKALELAQKNKDLTKLLKEQENSYEKGYEDGVKAISEFIKDDTDKFPNKDVIEAIQKALSIKVPYDLANLISKTQVQSEKEETTTKDKIGLGLGRAVGDV